MKIGFLFPGQGAQTTGMCKDLYDKYEEVREVYEKVKKVTGIDVADITFNPENEALLNQTRYTQICILTMSLAILKLLEKQNISAEISSGLSLGEYTSLIYSKKIDFETGVKLVKNRGEYMHTLVPEGNWKMAAILGMEDKTVEEVCSKVQNGFVQAVNFNCPGQVVASGDEAGIIELEELAKTAGAKRVKLLNTSGPFHTVKLSKASEALRKDLEKVSFGTFQSKVVRNLDGEDYEETDDMVEILANHITSPVRFSKGLENMIKQGVDTFIEIGPGRTLTSFVKKMETDSPITTLNINSVESYENTLQALGV